jgi:hypothetical protein
MSPHSETRRWVRQQVDLPVSVRCVANASVPPVCGRATEISEGGMAVYAGVELKLNDLMQVEFQAPSRTQVTGIVRNRSGYCFGLEFLTPLPVGIEEQSARRPIGGKPQSTEVPVLSSESIRLNEARMAKGSAVAYLVLAKVLKNAGKLDEARKALERGLVYLAESRNADLKAKELEMKRLRDQIEVLRSVAPVLEESQSRGAIDPRIAGILRALPKVLNRKNK